MLIKARLKGHEFDLLTLAELFREGDPAVATDHEGYYLSFTASDGLLDDGARLSDAASVLLRRCNGVARMLSSEFRPVGLTGRFSDETGRQHQVVLADTAEVRARANPVTVSMGGKPPPPPPVPGPSYVQLAQTHPDVAEDARGQLDGGAVQAARGDRRPPEVAGGSSPGREAGHSACAGAHRPDVDPDPCVSPAGHGPP